MPRLYYSIIKIGIDYSEVKLYKILATVLIESGLNFKLMLLNLRSRWPQLNTIDEFYAKFSLNKTV